MHSQRLDLLQRFICATMAPMAKKKNQSKKHKFKYAEATNSVQMDTAMRQQVAANQASANRPVQRLAQAGASHRDFGYVTKDLQRIIIMAAALIGFELVLWGLMTRTGLGDAVYRLIQV